MSVQIILEGHVLDVLKDFDDGFFTCIITSPPYWGLRDYGLEPLIWEDSNRDGLELPKCEHEWESEKKVWHGDRGKGSHKEVFVDMSEQSSQHAFCTLCGAWRGSLGLEPTFQLYLDHLIQIMAECKRVLKKTGTMWVNLGDTYYGGGNNRGNNSPISDKQASNKGAVGQVQMKWDKNFPAKSLIGIPERFVIRMTDELGMIRRNTIIWYKRNCMPSSAKDRFTVDWEPVFFFTKNKKYWFEQQFEPYTEPINRWGGEELKANGESIWDKGTGQASYRNRDMRPNEQGRNKRCVWGTDNREQLREIISGDGDVDHKIARIELELTRHTERSIWDITTKPFKGAHFAVFPPDLVEPMLSAGCPIDGWVLDPFAGSGTVGVVAKEQDKNFIGIELNPKYCEMADKRIE